MVNSELKKIFSQVKKTVKQKWFWKYVVILSMTVILVSTFVPVGIIYYLIYTYTDYRVIEETEPFKDFPSEWTFTEGKIINTARENYVFPDDPLVYQVTISNPKNFTRDLSADLKIFKGGELKDVVTRNWSVRQFDKMKTDLEFFLKEEGTYKFEIRFVFDRQIPGSEHPNHTFHIENFQVQSLSNKLLSEANFNNFMSYMAIFGVAVGGNIASIIYLRKQHGQTERQLNLTQKELESRLRADLDVIISDSNLKQDGEKWIGTIRMTVRNDGEISARNVNVHFQDPTYTLSLSQLIQKESEIKKTSFPIPGSIPSHSHYPELIMHKTELQESSVYELAIWVTYDYADVKDMEFIQIVKINNQVHSDGPLYEKEDIEREKKRLKEQGI